MFHGEKLTYQGSSSIVGNTYKTLLMAPAKEPKDGQLEVFGAAVSCRDALGNGMRTLIKEEKLPTDKLRLLVIWQSYEHKYAEEWCLRGLACLHAFEKTAGWPLTRIVRVDLPGKHYGVYFRASRRWLKAPYLTTLYILLVRMCEDSRIQGFKTLDQLVEGIDGMDRLARDQSYVKNSLQYWKPLALGYPYLFEQYKLPYYWSEDRLRDSAGYGEGIAKLVSGNTAFEGMYAKLSEVKEDIRKHGKLTLTRGKTKK